MVPLPWRSHLQRVGSVGLETGLVVASAVLGELVLRPPAEVERPQHWNIDAEAREHQLDAAEHEGSQGCSGKVAEEVDRKHLPKADDANYDTTVIVRQYTRGWWVECVRNLRCTESKARNYGKLLSFAHLQLPDGSDWQSENEHISEDVRHDERLKDGNLVHAFSNALQRPLLLDWGAEENTDEAETDAPEYDNRHATENPVSDMDRKYPHVEEELTELQYSQGPEVNQRETEGHLAGLVR
jgi:hypothetical protein